MVEFFVESSESLTHYVRYTAWLNTAPEPEKKQLSGALKPFTRLQKMRHDRQDDDYMPNLPDIEGLEHVPEYLWDCGPVIYSGMGEQPLSHTDIRHWQENTGIEVSAWLAGMIRRLSMEYLAQCQAAKSPDCPSPIEAPKLSNEERSSVAEKIQGALRMLMTTRPNRGQA